MNDVNLSDIQRLGQQFVDLVRKQERLKAEQKELAEKITHIQETALPEMMGEAGMTNFGLSDGTKITIKNFYYGSLPKTESLRQKALAFLTSEGHGDLIKNTVKVVFGKGEDERANQLVDNLASQGHNVNTNKTVHPMTLKAFIKEQLEQGVSLPHDLLGIHTGLRAEVNFV